MKLSPNFTLEELTRSTTAKKYRIDNTPTNKDVENLSKLCVFILQPIRDRYGKPLHISSGFRCKKLNQKVGGVTNSQHQYGEAADIDNGDKANAEIWDIIVHLIKSNVIDVGQLIKERSWIHISLPNGKHKNQIIG